MSTPGTGPEAVCRRRFANGLELVFYDESNRYFGDYHRVCVRVEGRFLPETEGERIPDAPGPDRESLRFSRSLTRMGVSGDDREETVANLVTEFLATAGPYLARPDAPRRLQERRAGSGRPGRLGFP